MPHSRPRARDLGLAIGTLPTGRWNAITDVPDVRVGHVTLHYGEPGPLIPGLGPVRTGVTAIVPHGGDLFLEKTIGVVHRINGFGEVTNSEQVREMGVIEGPIMLTNTLNVARVADAVIDWAFARDPAMGVTTWGISPVVAECSDMYLNDIRGRHVRAGHVAAAIDGATSGPVAEGAVGGGTGMSCCEFKGGIGTSSRVVPPLHLPPSGGERGREGGFTVGALVMSNFGRREHLIIDGVPVGRELRDWQPHPPTAGASPARYATSRQERGSGSSIIIVLA
ncbi:MAG: P1 family peptidase, partial [Chloroflexi bacterium]|nr:P1 family peptidase [Chloroflexota bacterium]